jgi:hypothetical protein
VTFTDDNITGCVELMRESHDGMLRLWNLGCEGGDGDVPVLPLDYGVDLATALVVVASAIDKDSALLADGAAFSEAFMEIRFRKSSRSCCSTTRKSNATRRRDGTFAKKQFKFLWGKRGGCLI